MQELNELKQELTALEAEHEALGLRYTELEKIEDAAPRDFSFLGNQIGTPEFYEAQKQRSDVGIKQQHVESRIARLNQRIQYLDQLAGADTVIAKAQADEEVASERVTRIGESLTRVVSQLEHLQNDEVQRSEHRQQAEQEAAQALAVATASGDSKALKAAKAQMDAVITEAHASRARQESNAPVISALEAEAEAQRQQLVTAQAEQKKAAFAVNAAKLLKKGAEWDEAVSVLSEVGADLVALGVGYPLTDLKVPTFAPGGRAITLADLRQQQRHKAA